MTSPDVPRLARRIAEQNDSLRAISDTVLEINTRVQAVQKVQRDHTTLLNDVRGKVENVETGLAAVQQVQHEQGADLDEIKTALGEILRRLGPTA